MGSRRTLQQVPRTDLVEEDRAVQKSQVDKPRVGYCSIEVGKTGCITEDAVLCCLVLVLCACAH